tara:strand:+ start:1042 stop:1548 length:507 start_codon:yes stop_codon:yes gene_type:complete
VRAGSLYLVLVGLSLCAAGVTFVFLMWRSFDRASGQRDWTEVQCTILESRVDERKIGSEVEVEYGFFVAYGYSFDGVPHTSERYSLRGSPWSSSRERSQRRVDKFPVGSMVPCFVDPADPSASVLKMDSKAPGYSLWFPAIFIIGGLGMIVGAIRGDMILRRSRSAVG